MIASTTMTVASRAPHAAQAALSVYSLISGRRTPIIDSRASSMSAR